MACACESPIEYETTPPYVSQRSLQRFIDGRCIVCNEAIAFNTEPTFPECCDDQIVTRGTSEVLRIDDASNTSYIGTGGAVSEYAFVATGTPTLTANVLYQIPVTTGGTLTTVINEIGIIPSENGFFVPRAGFYYFDATIDTANNTAAREINFAAYVNNAYVGFVQTYHNTGANPTENTNRRSGRIVCNTMLNALDKVSFIITSGLTINTTVSLQLRVVRLSVTR